jgi:hypothetical protein
MHGCAGVRATWAANARSFSTSSHTSRSGSSCPCCGGGHHRASKCTRSFQPVARSCRRPERSWRCCRCASSVMPPAPRRAVRGHADRSYAGADWARLADSGAAGTRSKMPQGPCAVTNSQRPPAHCASLFARGARRRSRSTSSGYLVAGGIVAGAAAALLLNPWNGRDVRSRFGKVLGGGLGKVLGAQLGAHATGTANAAQKSKELLRRNA